MIQNVCGTRVGILGLLTEETATSSSPGTTWFGDPVAVAKTIVQVMPRGYRRIVTLTHLHMQDDEGLLRAVPEIDVAIGGHDPDPMTECVGGRLIAMARPDGNGLGATRVALSALPGADRELA